MSTRATYRPELQCDGKRRYFTRADAKRTARRRRGEGHVDPGRFDAYRCPWCGWWHIGHRPANFAHRHPTTEGA